MVEDCGCQSCGCNNSITHEDVVNMIEDQTLPFTEEIIDELTYIRHFDETAADHLYKWHFDDEDRNIEVLSETDWKFQFDNGLPFNLNKGDILNITINDYHRLIKGTLPLSLKINKLK